MPHTAVLRTARPGGDGHGRADDPIVAYDTLDSVVVGIYRRDDGDEG